LRRYPSPALGEADRTTVAQALSARPQACSLFSYFCGRTIDDFPAMIDLISVLAASFDCFGFFFSFRLSLFPTFHAPGSFAAVAWVDWPTARAQAPGSCQIL
jgi:hypothetical protein